MASIKTLKHNRLMQKTDFASSIASATRWPSKDQNRHKASSAKMVGAENLNGILLVHNSLPLPHPAVPHD
jgi:hypothetical protein